MSLFKRRNYNYSSGSEGYNSMSGGGSSALKARLIMAAVVILFSVVTYYSQTQENPVTGEKQQVALSVEDEIALGFQSQQEMAMQFGGYEEDSQRSQAVEIIGRKLVNVLQKDLESRGKKLPYPFEFHLLADDQVVNAFALPGGQVFITDALFKLLESEDEIAGVVGHEIGHVLSRHGSTRIAKDQLIKGISGAAGVATGDYDSARIAGVVGQLIGLKYGRSQELEADEWGVKLNLLANYNPSAMLRVMDVLEQASSGGGAPPEFMSSHPKPANRKEYIKKVIEKVKLESAKL